MKVSSGMKRNKSIELIFYLLVFCVYALLPSRIVLNHDQSVTKSLLEESNQLILLLVVLYPLLVVISGIVASMVKARIMVLHLMIASLITITIIKYYNLSAMFYLVIYVTLLQFAYSLTNRFKHKTLKS